MNSRTLKLAAMAMCVAVTTACNEDDDNNADPVPAPETKGNMTVKFEHVWGPGEDFFSLNSELVHPETSDTLQFTKLRYYISNVELHNANGSLWQEGESYHLVDVANASGVEVELNLNGLPSGTYTGITYKIGVDSLRNVSGVQDGALDPAEGMFWSWNTGYIFAKAEGSSNVSSSGFFTYHLGGFLGEYSAIMEQHHHFQGGTLDISPEANPSVHLMVDAAKFWDSTMNSADVPMMHMPGETAYTIMLRFASGFRFDHVHN